MKTVKLSKSQKLLYAENISFACAMYDSNRILTKSVVKEKLNKRWIGNYVNEIQQLPDGVTIYFAIPLTAGLELAITISTIVNEMKGDDIWHD